VNGYAHREVSPTAPIIGALTLVAGCATYRAQPLPSEASLAEPAATDLEELGARAIRLQHAVLRPITLDLSDGLSPEEAAVLAVLSNPDLTAVRSARGEAAAQLIAAGLLPNPTFGAEVDRPYGSGAAGTVDASNVTLAFDLQELLGRSARVAAASGRLESLDESIAWQEWQVAQAAKLHVIRLSWLLHRMDLVSEEMEYQSQSVDVLEQAMAQGDAILSDVGVHRAALEGLRHQRDELEKTSQETRRELDRLLGLPPDDPTQVQVKAPPASWLPLPEAEDLRARAMTGRLDLESLRSGYQAQEAAVRQAIWNQFPAITIGVSRQRNETALKFLGGFVQLGLPIFNRNQGGIALERATRTRLREEYRARAAQVRSDVGVLVEGDRIYDRQLREADRGIIELMKIESAERGAVERGDLDRLAYQVARSGLADLRFQRAALGQARDEGRTALETACGALLFDDHVGER
jgi:outer membrane protein, heavy metal efflux system